MGFKSRSRQRISVRRAYEPPNSSDGERYLVDRVWPRGVSRDSLALVDWLPDAGPSHALRRWFGHRPSRWREFRDRYHLELEAAPDRWARLVSAARRGPITLVFGARDAEHNQAIALREYLLRVLSQATSGPKEKRG